MSILVPVDELLLDRGVNNVTAHFLAAKRSSTLALVPESVRPWSKLNFSLFSQLMTAFDSL